MVETDKSNIEQQRTRELSKDRTAASQMGFKTISKKGIQCHHCHQTVDEDLELCPYCKHPLHHDHCTYCGAPMDPDDVFCGECGGSTNGIQCPKCGTLSFRSFCPTCNHPVDALAKQELEKAKHDPIFQKMEVLAVRLAELEERIASREDVPDAPGDEELTQDIKDLLSEYAELLNTKPTVDNTPKQPAAKSRIQPDKKGILLSQRDSNHEKQAQEFREALKEMNDLMKQLIPEPGQTPQMQRNYYSARKVAVFKKTTTKSPVGWVCNYCGHKHQHPGECAKPDLGGNWEYESSEKFEKTYE